MTTMLPPGDVAPIGRRAVAYLIDAAIGFAIAVVVPTVIMIVVVMTSRDLMGSLLVASPVFGVLGIAWAVVYTLMQAGRGSIGMRAQGIRLVKANDGSPLGFGRALLRNVIWGLAASIVVGYFTVLFDGSGRFQGWHDKVAGALMLQGAAPAASGRTPAPSAAGAVPTAPTPAPAFGAPAQGAPAQGAPAQGAPGGPAFGVPAPQDAPAIPQTSMPGFARPGGFAPPPASAPPAAPAEPVHPGTAAQQQPADDEFSEHTVLSPPMRRDLPEDPLISFVPGVTQESAPMASAPEPAEPAAPAPVEPVSDPTPLDTVAARLGGQAASVPSVDAPGAPTPPPFVPPVASEQPVTAQHPLVQPDEHPLVQPDEPDGEQDDDIESTRISVPGHRLVFTWDDGQRATVSGRTVFGRNPEDDGAVNVAVRDETRSLSKTHFEAGAETRGGWVMDRRSTNGTVIVRDGVRIACPPGQRVPIRLGDALEIGDRIVTIGGYV
ncbi:RDD family protein [Microbacterium sp. ARD32]|uniref:RDD family protein n=1 Tax=Microbacterium sp. ARD32 TaxID=2962577 RepID=UPI002881AC4E|nr:RDD family protein [Microbacterium sp. ARD32]MDT0156120.1 RDD family protein [Microbacterium sp. ARD32]